MMIQQDELHCSISTENCIYCQMQGSRPDMHWLLQVQINNWHFYKPIKLFMIVSNFFNAGWGSQVVKITTSFSMITRLRIQLLCQGKIHNVWSGLLNTLKLCGGNLLIAESLEILLVMHGVWHYLSVTTMSDYFEKKTHFCCKLKVIWPSASNEYHGLLFSVESQSKTIKCILTNINQVLGSTSLIVTVMQLCVLHIHDWFVCWLQHCLGSGARWSGHKDDFLSPGITTTDQWPTQILIQVIWW